MLSEGDGIFTDLQTQNVPWREYDIANILNYGYYLNSAQKLVSPFVFDVKDFPNGVPDGTPLTQAQRTTIAQTVYQMFIKKWDRLWDLYNIEYNPIHDYNLVENETIEGENEQTVGMTGTDIHDISRSETDGGTDSTTTTETIANTGTDTTVVDGDTTDTGTNTTVVDGETTDTGTVGVSETTNTERGIYGFNSSTDQGSDTEYVTHNSTETRNLAATNDTTTTETRNLASTTDTTTTETKNLQTTDNTTESRTRNLTHSATNSDVQTRNLQDETSGSHNSTRELQKSGNIGFNKPQEMLTAELEFWQWNFFKSVFEDIDTVLTMCVY